MKASPSSSEEIAGTLCGWLIFISLNLNFDSFAACNYNIGQNKHDTSIDSKILAPSEGNENKFVEVNLLVFLG